MKFVSYQVYKMNKPLLFLAVTFFIGQIGSQPILDLTIPKQDILEIAEAKLAELTEIVSKSVDDGMTQLDQIQNDVEIVISNVRNDTDDLIIRLSDEFTSNINNVKEEANNASVNITICLEHEGQIAELAEKTEVQVGEDLLSISRQVSAIVDAAKVFTVNQTNVIEVSQSQIDICEMSDPLFVPVCLQSVIINMDNAIIQVPQDIAERVDIIASTANSLKEFVKVRADAQVSNFNMEGSAIVEEIIECARNIING